MRSQDETREDRTQGRAYLPDHLVRVNDAAKRSRQTRFTALLHHMDVEALERAFRRLRREAAPGVDGMTVEIYEGRLADNLRELCDRVHGGRYKPLPVRRTYIPKADASPARRQDAADRVRTVRRDEPSATERRAARDVRFPGLHALLRKDPGRAVHGPSQNPAGTLGPQAEGTAAAIETADARASARTAWMAGSRAARALRILWRHRQQLRPAPFPDPGRQSLAWSDMAARAKAPNVMGPVQCPSARQPAAAAEARSRLARTSGLRRGYSSEEPDAGKLQVRICGGGGGRPPPLPDRTSLNHKAALVESGHSGTAALHEVPVCSPKPAVRRAPGVTFWHALGRVCRSLR